MGPWSPMEFQITRQRHTCHHHPTHPPTHLRCIVSHRRGFRVEFWLGNLKLDDHDGCIQPANDGPIMGSMNMTHVTYVHACYV